MMGVSSGTPFLPFLHCFLSGVPVRKVCDTLCKLRDLSSDPQSSNRGVNAMVCTFFSASGEGTVETSGSQRLAGHPA